MKSPISLLRSSNVVMCAPAASLCTSSRAAAVCYSAQEVCALLREISPACTTITRFAKLAYCQTKTSIICFPDCTVDNRFMKLITKAADGHSDAITQVNNSDVQTVKSSACGHRSAEFFVYFAGQC